MSAFTRRGVKLASRSPPKVKTISHSRGAATGIAWKTANCSCNGKISEKYIVMTSFFASNSLLLRSLEAPHMSSFLLQRDIWRGLFDFKWNEWIVILLNKKSHPLATFDLSSQFWLRPSVQKMHKSNIFKAKFESATILLVLCIFDCLWI